MKKVQPEMQTLNQPSGQVPRETTNYADDNKASGVPQSEARRLSEARILHEPNIDGESNAPAANGGEVAPYGQTESVLPVTPPKVDIEKDGLMRNGRTKSGEPEERTMKPEEPLAGSSSEKGRCRSCSVGT